MYNLDEFDDMDEFKVNMLEAELGESNNLVAKLRNQNHKLRAELQTATNQNRISQVGVQTLTREMKKLKDKIIYADKMIQSLRIDARADLSLINNLNEDLKKLRNEKIDRRRFFS